MIELIAISGSLIIVAIATWFWIIVFGAIRSELAVKSED